MNLTEKTCTQGAIAMAVFTHRANTGRWFETDLLVDLEQGTKAFYIGAGAASCSAAVDDVAAQTSFSHKHLLEIGKQSVVHPARTGQRS